MSYRRKGEQIHNEQVEWANWLSEHADLVDACGLPSDIVSNKERWNYFVDHVTMYGYEQWPSFSIEELSPLQKAALMRLIMTWPTYLNTYLGHYLITALVEAVEARYKE